MAVLTRAEMESQTGCGLNHKRCLCLDHNYYYCDPEYVRDIRKRILDLQSEPAKVKELVNKFLNYDSTKNIVHCPKGFFSDIQIET